MAASTFIFPYKILGGEASQNTRNTVQHQARPGDDSTFFLRESGLSSGTQKAPIAEGRGFTVRRVSLSVSLSSCLSVYHVKHMVHPNTHTFCMGKKTHPKYNLRYTVPYTKKRKKKEENTGRRTKKKEKKSTYRAEEISLSLPPLGAAARHRGSSTYTDNPEAGCAVTLQLAPVPDSSALLELVRARRTRLLTLEQKL